MTVNNNPSSGYEINSVNFNGSPFNKDTKIEIKNVTKSGNYFVDFKEKEYEVEPIVVGKSFGTLTPGNIEKVKYGRDSRTYTATPKAKCKRVSFTAKGRGKLPDYTNNHQFQGVKEDKWVRAEFRAKYKYNYTYQERNVKDGIVGENNTSVVYEDDTLTIKASDTIGDTSNGPYYKFSSIEINGKTYHTKTVTLKINKVKKNINATVWYVWINN